MRRIEDRLTRLEVTRRDHGEYQLRAEFERWTDSELLNLVQPGWENRAPLTPDEQRAYQRFLELEGAIMDTVAGCQDEQEAERLIAASLARLCEDLQPRISRAVAMARARGEKIVKVIAE